MDNTRDSLQELLRVMQLEIERIKFTSDQFQKELEQLKRRHERYAEKDTQGFATLEDRVKGLSSQIGSLARSQEQLEEKFLKLQDLLDKLSTWRTQRDTQLLMLASLPAAIGGVLFVIKFFLNHE